MIPYLLREVDRNIQMIRGDTLAFGIVMDGLDTDISSAYFTVRSKGVVVFQKSLNNGITKEDTNTYKVRVAPADTKDLDTGHYYYDLQIGVNSDIFTVLHGDLELIQDATY